MFTAVGFCRIWWCSPTWSVWTAVFDWSDRPPNGEPHVTMVHTTSTPAPTSTSSKVNRDTAFVVMEAAVIAHKIIVVTEKIGTHADLIYGIWSVIHHERSESYYNKKWTSICSDYVLCPMACPHFRKRCLSWKVFRTRRL